MRGIGDTIIHDLFSKIVALLEGWPLMRVAMYRKFNSVTSDTPSRAPVITESMSRASEG